MICVTFNFQFFVVTPLARCALFVFDPLTAHHRIVSVSRWNYFLCSLQIMQIGKLARSLQLNCLFGRKKKKKEKNKINLWIRVILPWYNRFAIIVLSLRMNEEKERNEEKLRMRFILWCLLVFGSADAPPTINLLLLCLWMRAKLLIAFELVPIKNL